MRTQTVKLLDPSRKVVATAQIADEGAYHGGTIDLRETPAELRSLFEEFEEIVNGQMFGLLDDIQERIAARSLEAVFATGQEVQVKDLQVFPSTGEVSFCLEGVPTSGKKLG